MKIIIERIEKNGGLFRCCSAFTGVRVGRNVLFSPTRS